MLKSQMTWDSLLTEPKKNNDMEFLEAYIVSVKKRLKPKKNGWTMSLSMLSWPSCQPKLRFQSRAKVAKLRQDVDVKFSKSWGPLGGSVFDGCFLVKMALINIGSKNLFVQYTYTIIYMLRSINRLYIDFYLRHVFAIVHGFHKTLTLLN